MKNYAELTHFAGLDWAKDHHDVNIMDRQGRVVARFRFAHSGPGWQEWREKIQAYPALGVAIETSHGAAVEQLLASGVTVYPVHPQAAKAYRQRQAPSGTKDDELDAWSLGDALRLDGAHWRALSPQDAIVEELRLLCGDEAALIEQRTALVNQLQAALEEYYPAALEAFEDWTAPYAWAFIQAFPTPQRLVQVHGASAAGVSAHAQAVAAGDGGTPAGNLCAGRSVLRGRGGDAGQEPAGAGAVPFIGRVATAIGWLSGGD